MDLLKRIDPELIPALEMMPADARIDFKDMPKAREMFDAMFSQMAALMPEVESVETEDKSIPGPGDAPNVTIRIYKPKTMSDVLPALLWIHGGGYIMGDLVIDNYSLKRICEATHCVVVAVDYRLAPENPYPDGLEDCYAALKWMVRSSDQLRIDKTKIAIGGGSAGGGMAAALALLARDRNEIKIAFQLLVYPMLDCRNVTPSSYAIDDPRTWNREKNLFAWDAYLGKLAGRDDIPPYASPSLAKDLSGLPPAYVTVGDLDLFLDETIEYAQRLLQAGVPTEFHIYPGAIHGFDGNEETTIAKRAIAEKKHAIMKALF